jgi:hypothetical protein
MKRSKRRTGEKMQTGKKGKEEMEKGLRRLA